MRILHTADWHLGQLFHEYDRSFEHQEFLNWLLKTITNEAIEVLLVSGDVFDISNPAAASIRMFYSFLQKATSENPHLQIIITAGNHDSASRLEAPKPLLASSKIHIIGTIEKNSDGSIDYAKLTVPLYDHLGEIKAWCIAIPFLRIGDYPTVSYVQNPYSEGVTTLYREAFEFANTKKNDKQSIIAMGHLHTHNAEISDMDKTERLIMGGVECIPATAFHPEIKYVALGHIHKAQRIGGKEHIRYCGSPLPMSFSERNYKHQVIIFDLEAEISNLKTLEIPVTIPLLRIPLKAEPLEEVLLKLHQLEDKNDDKQASYLEIQVLLEAPEPALRHKIDEVLKFKNVKLARIQPHYPNKNKSIGESVSQALLHELQPAAVFAKSYEAKYNTEVPEQLMALFQQTIIEVNQPEA
ncbi:exonuclease SbcCD subunit D C-terminal domain-containing protein [Flavobacterium antarcticum]|uniref:exonuclease SbcCD subunit D C-terminal domain-containing protein n=1 Tax=Flavobacterium antarcticum TaxID=271155 RepID=UPI0003B57961|nr:exonuclease SbcCD subunit D C-terminal domain-containing protein [Flavobacterium antarcticum]